MTLTPFGVERVTQCSEIPSSEACMLGNFGSAIMGAKYRFALQWERGTSFESLYPLAGL